MPHSGEAATLREEVRILYSENAALKERLSHYEREGEFRAECEAEIARLRNVLGEMRNKENRPSEREEIKDRIIMKLEDELITARLELKEAQLQLSRFSRIQ